MIIGSGGAGKSRLARELGALTGLPVIHLDREHWWPRWQPTPAGEWLPKVRELAARDRWILDGHYGSSLDIRMERADTIIFLDFSRWRCVGRVIRRWLAEQREGRPDMAPGCVERFDPAFLLWVWRFPAVNRPALLARLDRFRAGRRVLVLRSPAEVRRFLAAEAAGGPGV